MKAYRDAKPFIVVLGLLKWHVWIDLLMWFGSDFMRCFSAPQKFWPFSNTMCDMRAETHKDSNDGYGCEGQMQVMCRVVLLSG